MKPITYEQALGRMAVWCSKAERCKADLKKKLSVLEISDADTEKIIRYLEKEKFLDEHRYARAFVHDKSRYNGWGVNKIKYELIKKGIPEPIINESLQTIDSPENLDRLKRLLDHKRKSVKGANDYEINSKLIRFALGRGFSYDEVMKVIKNEENESN